MDLYSRDFSPFAARVRVSILAKGLPIRIIGKPVVGSVRCGARRFVDIEDYAAAMRASASAGVMMSIP